MIDHPVIVFIKLINSFYTVTMAKGIGNGFPMGAVVTTPGTYVHQIVRLNWLGSQTFTACFFQPLPRLWQELYTSIHLVVTHWLVLLGQLC